MKFLSPWMDLSFRDLFYLLELYQRGSLRVVARDLKIAPSQLSKLIQRAEESFGVSLFFRSSSGLRPNPDAEELWRKIRAFVENSSDFGIPSKRDFLLSISAPSFLCQHLLTRALSGKEAFHSARLLEVSDKVALSLAYSGVIDVQISLSTFEFPKVWETLKLGDLRSALFARVDHPLFSKVGREVGTEGEVVFSEAEISRYEFVAPLDYPESGREYGHDLCPLPIQLRKKGIAVSTANTALDWIQCTDQLTFVPEMVARRAVMTGSVREVKCSEWRDVWAPVYFSYNTEKMKARVLKELLEQLKLYCRDEPTCALAARATAVSVQL